MMSFMWFTSLQCSHMATRTASRRWLSTTEAADELGVTTRTVYRLIDDGALCAHRIGRVIRVMATELDAFLDRSRIRPGTLGHLHEPPDRSD
jgi:excisionase family DNA binding protein